jgi:phosphoribosylaminoimidazolecarboxamide formyltransferase/IMP cyclohydrolase
LNFTRKEKQNYFSQNENLPQKQVRTCLNGTLVQEKITLQIIKSFKTVTTTKPSNEEIEDLIFASKNL